LQAQTVHVANKEHGVSVLTHYCYQDYEPL